MPRSDLTEVVNAFQDWEKPWTFYSTVLSQLSRDSEDPDTLSQIWAEACRADHWQQADISKACDAVDCGLKIQFSWLPEDARRPFVRAASYQWK